MDAVAAEMNAIAGGAYFAASRSTQTDADGCWVYYITQTRDCPAVKKWPTDANALEARARENISARSEAAATLGRRGGSSTSHAKQAASRANGAKGGRPAWRILDRWDVDADGAEDMLVSDGRRTILLCRRHNLGAADPATWCVAFDATGVANVRASVAASGEHIHNIALAPLEWGSDIVARVARTAERNA